MIAIVDYGVGNLFSLLSSFKHINAEARITASAREILSADRLLLPGVGAFGDAADKLKSTGLDEAIKAFARTGRPLMGVCLGMQLLFARGFEFGERAGLNLLDGDVVKLEGMIPEALKIPHIGWNRLTLVKDHPLIKYTRQGDCVYFVHSYHATNCEEHTLATAEYGAPITAIAARDNVCGCQFHPEKSGGVGLGILRAFAEM